MGNENVMTILPHMLSTEPASWCVSSVSRLGCWR